MHDMVIDSSGQFGFLETGSFIKGIIKDKTIVTLLRRERSQESVYDIE